MSHAEFSRAYIGALMLALAPVSSVPAETSETIEIQGATLGRFGESGAVDPDTFKFSEAESQLWMADHLRNISSPVRLRYDFVRSGTYEDGFTDFVLLDIREINGDGSKNADMQFFTGDRSQPFTPDNVTAIRGNPVLGIYMRGDIYDMNRLTNGSWRYFQRRIKLALSDGATIDSVTIDYNGKKVPAKRIVISPYVKDPHSAQFQQFIQKRYEFTLSDAVPGSLYQIHTIVPGEKPEDPPLLEEKLTLTQVGPVGKSGGR